MKMFANNFEYMGQSAIYKRKIALTSKMAQNKTKE